MKNSILAFVIALAFIGCSAKAPENKNIEANLVVGKSFSSFTLNDQFEKAHTLNADTKKIIFAFSKDSAHTCNDFFKTQNPSYLSDNHTEFIADVSAAPSLIRSMFIMPGLKDFKHIVLLFEDKTVAAPYKKGLDINKIAVVFLMNGKIEKIDFITTAEELQKIIE